ncbi:MAG TPA: RNA polymerase sigma factor [Patescibacteria group bacterium]|nr:RNA polymerase sigma factor [Patescibacteria group bacterium]
MDNHDIAEKSDEELVDLILDNQILFAYLINRYQNKLLRYIKRISNLNSEDAQDLLQEIFVKVYRNLAGFNKKLKFSSWIYRIAHNEVINNYRKQKARPRQIHWDDLNGDDGWFENLASDFNLENEINNKLNYNIILAVLKNLDYKYKEVLELRFWEEKNYQEISDILKKPMGTVATLISRAKKQFKQEFVKQNIKL